MRQGLLLLLCSCRAFSGPGDDTAADAQDTGPQLPDTQIDNDGDGYTEEEGDCDDSATTVHPGGLEGETADGRDNDCNGIVDDMPSCPGVDKGIDTLQQAIDAAPEGMTLVVCPGTYEERLVIEDRSVGIWAAEGPEDTIIQGDQSDSVITISGSDKATISGFTISGGRSLSHGGAVFATHSTVEIRSNIIREAEAVLWGGGIYCESCEGSITGNTIENGRAAHGGGVAVYFGRLEITGNTIRGNTAYSQDNNVFGSNYGGGGGILIVGDSSFGENIVEANHSLTHGGGLYIVQGEGEVWNNTFQLNTCDLDGAGVLTNLSRNYLHDNLFSENIAYDDGGGMRVYVGGMTIENNEFLSNTAHNQGGAMKLSHAANTVTGNLLEGNWAADAGGAIELDNDASLIQDNIFLANTAYRGGGLHTWFNEEEVWIVGNEFRDNVATWCGGAIQADYDHYTVTLLHNQIIGNEAPYGAGLCTKDYVDLVVQNSVFRDNSASTSGGVAYINGGDTRFVNSVLYGNTGTAQPGIYSYSGTITMLNSVVMNHDPGPGWTLNGTTTDIRYNIFYGNITDISSGEISTEYGNILQDPLFVDAEADNWELSEESPGIDSGDPKILDSDGSRSDIGLHGGPEAD